MNAMTNNHIGTEDAIGEGGRDYRMSRSDIEGVLLWKTLLSSAILVKTPGGQISL